MLHSLINLRRNAHDALSDLPALKLKAEKVAAHILHGGHGQRKAGGHEKFWQYREYQNSDRPQDIDWRQSAKTDHVYVREKEQQNPQSFYFWAQNDESMRFQSNIASYSKCEAAQILSLALAILLTNSDERVGMVGQRVSIGDQALDKIGISLLNDDTGALPEGHIPAKSNVFLCGDFLSPIEDIELQLNAFFKPGVRGHLIQILDPAECDLPYDGHVIFENAHAQDSYKIENVADIRKDYKKRIEQHLQDIGAVCNRLGLKHIVHITDQSLESTLIKIWEAYQR